ncbi:sulfotransferase family 2 domain-containing protein [Elongatibacter sediminis]|uniref:Sulfotransferase family 2 domain-containing protein n=1 Tax=Elongatibacter sediminis TaxID=3119006 RepID=A0AAW9RJG8_9GAMM
MKHIVFLNGRLGYRDLPKVASTSIKAAIYQLEEGEAFCHKKLGMHVHTYMRRNKRGEISACEKTFVVVRDPIERVLSAYKNRVLFHQELSEAFVRENFAHHYWDIPYFTPGLGQFIEHFDDYLLIRPIFHHCRPMVDFFEGRNLEDYTHVYKMEELGRLAKDLSSLTGEAVEFERRQTGGKKYSVRDLTKSQLEKLVDYYAKDYELLAEHYTVDEVWSKWRGVEHSPEVPRPAEKTQSLLGRLQAKVRAGVSRRGPHRS